MSSSSSSNKKGGISNNKRENVEQILTEYNEELTQSVIRKQSQIKVEKREGKPSMIFPMLQQ
jgi:hypothetical protein